MLVFVRLCSYPRLIRIVQLKGAHELGGIALLGDVSQEKL